MPTTIATRSVAEGVPVITALLRLDGVLITSTPLSFIIDTAAVRTLVTPRLESQLKANEPQYDWDSLFVPKAEIVDTIMGPALFKKLCADLALCFLANDGIHMWSAPLDSLLFSDRTPSYGGVYVRPGESLNFGILGQDVLSQQGFLTAYGQGLVPSNGQAVARIIEAMRASEPGPASAPAREASGQIVSDSAETPPLVVEDTKQLEPDEALRPEASTPPAPQPRNQPEVNRALDWKSAMQTLWWFLVHVVTGTALFLLVYVPATGLNLLVNLLTELQVSRALIYVVQGAEFSLIVAGTALYVAFLFKTSWRTVKAL